MPSMAGCRSDLTALWGWEVTRGTEWLQDLTLGVQHSPKQVWVFHLAIATMYRVKWWSGHIHSRSKKKKERKSGKRQSSVWIASQDQQCCSRL